MRNKIYFSLATLFLLTVFIAACGNNKSNSTNPNPLPVNPYGYNNGYQNCIGCNPSSEIYRGESQSLDGSSRVSIGFFATQMVNSGYANPNMYQYSMNPVTYSGAVVAQGQVYINYSYNSGYNGYCQLPAGVYSVSTIAPGQWTSAVFTQIRVQLNGPVVATGVLSGTVGAKNSQYYGLTWSEMPRPYVGPIYGGQLTIDSLNGAQCLVSVSL